MVKLLVKKTYRYRYILEMGSPACENPVRISSTVSKIFPDKQSDISILFICRCIHSTYITYVYVYVFIMNMRIYRNINIDQYKTLHNADCYVCCFYISA